MDRSGDPPASEDHPMAIDIPTLLSRADVGVVQLSPRGEVVAANAGFETLTGHDPGPLAGTPFVNLLATTPPTLESFLDREFTAGESVTLTAPLETPEGEVVACDSHFGTVGDEDDRAIVGVLHESPDQSARTGRPRETAPAKAFVALSDSLPDGIIVLDPDSRIQYANPAVERILGHAPDDLVGSSQLSIIPERLREVHLEALDRYLETGERTIDWEYVELPGQHRGGHEVPLGISFNDFFFEGKRYFVGLFRDISSRKEAERELLERERHLDQYRKYTDDILDAIDDMFYVLDAEGHLQRWNDTIREVTGYTDEEIASMHALDFFDEEEQAVIETALEEGFETGSVRVEADLLTGSGESVPYEFVAAALEDPDGKRVLAGIGRDISVREEQRRKLEASNERLEQFAYAASHDLREPLRMVSSYLQLIDQRYSDELDEEGQEFIEFAVDGAERMRDMIQGLLRYSRVDTQGGPLEAVDLNAVLDDVENDLELKIEETDARITADDLPRVTGDGGQLRQVFQNLLSNAIDYSDGRPEVEVSAEREGEMWRISVRDNGIGMDPDETEYIFQVFQRLHSQNERGGTGIGLALCRRIVERHGGEIWAESTPGEGTTFSFTLPATGDGDS